MSDEFSPEIEGRIRQLSNNLSASELYDQCLECYKLFTEHLELSKRLVRAFPDRICVFSLANSLLNGDLLEKEESQFGSGLIEEEEIVKTHGYSTSVRDLLIKAHRSGTSFQVVTTERRMVQELERQGVMTIPSAANFQKAFVGAERVSENFFINSAGTRRLALDVPELYVVCDTRKFVAGHLRAFTHKQHQLSGESFLNVILANPYFEMVPLSLAKGIICEKGVLQPAEVKDYMLETDFWGLLAAT